MYRICTIFKSNVIEHSQVVAAGNDYNTIECIRIVRTHFDLTAENSYSLVRAFSVLEVVKAEASINPFMVNISAS